MPLWAWLIVAIAVLLAVMWVYDRQVRARRERLGDPSAAMARGGAAVQGNPEAHRGAASADRFLPPGGGTF